MYTSTLIYYAIVPIISALSLLSFLDFRTWGLFLLSIFSPLRIIALVIFLFSLGQFIAVITIKGMSEIYLNSLTDKNYVSVKCGAPGCGKSSSALYEAVELSRRMWSELQYKYWLYDLMSRLDTFKFDEKMTADWYEIKRSYEYYTTHDCVPCLFTNIPIMVNGLYTSVLTAEHAKQEYYLPLCSVLFFDEIGAYFSVNDSYKKRKDTELLKVSDFFRLCRHFGEFRIFCTEQDATNIFNDVRRVVSQNELMLGQKWVLKPVFLMNIFNKLKMFAIENYVENVKFAKILIKIESIIKDIGFRKYNSILQVGSTESGYINKENKIYYAPSRLNGEVDDRTFKKLYLAKDKEPLNEVWSSLCIDEKSFFAQSFIKARVQDE